MESEGEEASYLELARQPSIEVAETLIQDADELLKPHSNVCRSESRQLATAWDLQAALSFLIPNYVDDVDILSRLMNVKEDVDDYVQQHSGLPGEDDFALERTVAQFEEDLRPARHFPSRRPSSTLSATSTPVRTPRRADSEENLQQWASMHEELLRGLEGLVQEEASEEELECCSICFEERVLEMLPCGNVFCAECIQMHLHTMIVEGRALELKCPAMDCDYRITADVAHTFLTDTQFKRYRQFLLTAQIRDDPDRKCCPTPDCTGVLVKSAGNDDQDGWMPHPYTRCATCGEEKCFLCLRQYHDTESCQKYENGLQLRHLLAEEENIERWRQENNAKACPRCNELIVKSEGCNHIRCMTCGENFCWLCGARGATEGHFNVPGKCFGRLFEEEESTRADNVAGLIGSILVMPLTAPTFGIASLIEGARRQRAKMSRRLHGVDFKVAVVGIPGSGKTALCESIARHTPLEELQCLREFGISKYVRRLTVNLVSCRFQLFACTPEALKQKEAKLALGDIDGFVLCFSVADVESFGAVVGAQAGLRRLMSRPGVPGLLLGTKKSRKDPVRVEKAAAAERAAQLGVHLRMANVKSTWSSHMALRSFAKKLLLRWEPVVDPVLQEQD